MNPGVQNCPPVLFLVFNRPQLTRRSLSAIRDARPLKLFVAADGPRKDRVDENHLCTETRAIVRDGIDWPCEVSYLYQNQNLGCEVAVSTAISWFFENVEAGIILEDDCVPEPSFFDYCDTLLREYASNDRVSAIAGTSFQPSSPGTTSYYFSKYPHPWGWATWRRAWNKFNFLMALPADVTDLDVILRYSTQKLEQQYWLHQFRQLRDCELNTWDYRWFHSVWLHAGLTATPYRNLVANVGFSPDATHTKTGAPVNGGFTEPMQQLIHPRCVKHDIAADRITAERLFQIPSNRTLFRRKVVDYLRATRTKLHRAFSFK